MYSVHIIHFWLDVDGCEQNMFSVSGDQN